MASRIATMGPTKKTVRLNALSEFWCKIWSTKEPMGPSTLTKAEIKVNYNACCQKLYAFKSFLNLLLDKWLCKTDQGWAVVNNDACNTSCGAYLFSSDVALCAEDIDSHSGYVIDNNNWEATQIEINTNINSACDIVWAQNFCLFFLHFCVFLHFSPFFAYLHFWHFCLFLHDFWNRKFIIWVRHLVKCAANSECVERKSGAECVCYKGFAKNADGDCTAPDGIFVEFEINTDDGVGPFGFLNGRYKATEKGYKHEVSSIYIRNVL